MTHPKTPTPGSQGSSGPRSFLQTGMQPTARPAPVGLRVVEGRQVLPRAVPTLTVYADGHVNLNAEASTLLSDLAPGVCLCPPEPVRASVHPKPWAITAGACHRLTGPKDKPGQLRFWPDPSECPPPGRYLLLPVAGQPARFTLLPG